MNIINKSKNTLKNISPITTGAILLICEVLLLAVHIAIEPESNFFLFTALFLMIAGTTFVFYGIKKKSRY